jgi:tetratricopeptide (TPR) repeat protein
VGEALEKQPNAAVGELALHFTRAASPADAEKAIAYATTAGRQAAAVQAHEDAAEHYSRALQVLVRFDPDARERRCELLLLMGEARLRAGERVAARAALMEAATLAIELGDSGRLARAAIGASERYVQQPGVIDTELIGLLERALELTEGEVTVDRVRLLGRLTGALYYSPERGRMIELSAQAASLAERLGDPEALAHARAARRRALWDPWHLPERLAASTEMLRCARRARNLDLHLQAHAWLVLDLLEAGDRDAADAQVEAFTHGASPLRDPLYVWQSAIWRSMSAEGVTAPQYHAIQLLGIRREQARMGELEPAARQMVSSNPARPAWRSAFATMLVESDRLDEAATELEALAAHDFKDVPRDGDWLATMSLLSDVTVGLGDEPRAAMLYEALRSCAGATVVAGIGAVCLGSAARTVGKLAAMLGRRREAAEHFEHALEVNRRLRAPAMVAHTKLDYAVALGGAQAEALVDEAAETAEQLELGWVAQRVARLRIG